MKFLKHIVLLVGLYLFVGKLGAQELRSEVFSLLNLDYPGLEQVKALHASGKDSEAASALLEYYKQRKGIRTPDVDLKRLKISQEEQKWADEALEHTFFAHKGYQPSFNYGQDINWKYWPVQDNELRWQLHRHKWFTPMGKAYRLSGDEKYAKEWAFQYMDWIKKNPLVKINKDDYEMKGKAAEGEAENARFAWRPLEVSHRLQDQTSQFQLFITSPSFTPEFLTEFLLNYHKHAVHILQNYSDQGNHLLFEAQRIMYAGVFFPEFKEAAAWRKSGIDILNREIGVQVYEDGGQFELDPHYHLAAINIFCKALYLADMNGFRNEFPQKYMDTVENMIMFYLNICFPDYTNPCFSDAKLAKKKEMIKNYKEWHKLYPENQTIQYFATEGKQGALPAYLSKGFLKSGFFVFRNSWGTDAVQMVVKAGPKAFWHCQPDNGTFELWFNGKNLFPDSGSYVYAGDEEVMKWRNWFRQTRVHNTLTLNDETLETTESVTRLWQPEGKEQILVTENQGYKNLKHRRSVFFVDNTYFVIVDEAVGTAKGMINLHYQMPRGKIANSREDMTFVTEFEPGSNMKLQCFGPEGMSMKKEEGWQSTDYRKKMKRMNVSFNARKSDETPVRYITVIYPVKNTQDAPKISAAFKNKKFNEQSLEVEVKINGKKRILKYNL
ncbi:heparin-sulfate lyase HepC [Phocaeicola faecicola]|uniref:heparin-sulfate lyase HepC n=1 Tax=Phocaeicola faecicola TaxID=2739389 RepID=UPI002A7F9209|nr:heparin-sulfate lyase HepC [Phocaeicola faecicola]MCI5743804.1 heparinase II/III family protein [Bacteroides sp.]MDD6908239.1 heparinase II/III family protein [Bacteroidaceae bacterium]MDY4871664.1 heparinase II/III family protein [Phocaeicola faecicola]